MLPSDGYEGEGARRFCRSNLAGLRDDFLASHCRRIALKHAVVQLAAEPETFLSSLSTYAELLTCVQGTEETLDSENVLLQETMQLLQQRMRKTPPFPSTIDHLILAVLQLVMGNYTAAIKSLNSAGKSHAVCLVIRIEALWALKQYDNLVSVVIESLGGELQGSFNEEDKKRALGGQGFAAKALQSIRQRSSSFSLESPSSSPLSSSRGLPVPEEIADFPLLRRGLAYFELSKLSGNDVFQFKSSQDFATLFQTAGNRPEPVQALFKAAKALIADNSETSTALLHQAAALSPNQWEFPYLSSRVRSRLDSKALVDVEAALRLAPGRRSIQLQRWLLFIEQNRAAEALHELHSFVMEQDPNQDDPWIFILRGRARQLTSDVEGAMADYRRAVPLMCAGQERARLLAELSVLIYLSAKDREVTRPAAMHDLLLQVEANADQIMEEDKGLRCFGALKLRSQVRVDLETNQEGAIEDLLAFVKALCERSRRIGAELLSDELRVCVKRLRTAERYEDMQQVATLGIMTLSASPVLCVHFYYWYSYSLKKAGNPEMALKQALEGLAMFDAHVSEIVGEEENRDRPRLVTLIQRCGGEAPAKPTAGASAGQVRPAGVPPLVFPIPVATRNRRKTIGAGELTKSQAHSSTGSPLAKQKMKSRRKSNQNSGSKIEKKSTSPPPPDAPPAPEPYCEELPAPPCLQLKLSGDGPKSPLAAIAQEAALSARKLLWTEEEATPVAFSREEVLEAENKQLRQELAAAREELQRLKGENSPAK